MEQLNLDSQFKVSDMLSGNVVEIHTPKSWQCLINKRLPYLAEVEITRPDGRRLQYTIDVGTEGMNRLTCVNGLGYDLNSLDSIDRETVLDLLTRSAHNLRLEYEANTTTVPAWSTKTDSTPNAS
jgi:hypothetical protein